MFSNGIKRHIEKEQRKCFIVELLSGKHGRISLLSALCEVLPRHALMVEWSGMMGEYSMELWILAEPAETGCG